MDREISPEDARELGQLIAEPVRALMERVLGLMERLTDRVEVLELEVLGKAAIATGVRFYMLRKPYLAA